MATSDGPVFAPNPFWDYSLSLYARPGVAEACLRLQERHGLDVNLLLFCCWAGEQGRRLSGRDLQALTAAVADWHGQVVVPLRGLRRWLKGRAGTARAAAGRLRERVKEQELEAERIEQDLLHETLPLAGNAASPVAATANLAGYLRLLNVQSGLDDNRDLTVLLGEAFPGWRTQAEHGQRPGGPAKGPQTSKR